MLILIDIRSIKRNPTAGRTRLNIFGPTTTTFVCHGEIPDKLKSYFEEWEWSIVNGKVVKCSGYIRNFNYVPVLLEEFNKLKILLHIESKRDVQTVYSIHPEPKYLYKHLNPPVQCNECSLLTLVKEIVEECDDEGDCQTLCNHCNASNSFDYEYETIEQAIKRGNVKI
jgi:hypothetical protein